MLSKFQGPREAEVGDNAGGTWGELFEQFERWLVKEISGSHEFGGGIE